jgi:hypothetical protein
MEIRAIEIHLADFIGVLRRRAEHHENNLSVRACVRA